MHRRLSFISLGYAFLIIQPLFASLGHPKKTEEFRDLVAWAQHNGVPQNLRGGIPESIGAKTTKINVTACSFNELEANAKHVFCVSAGANHRKFLFFILMDVGDGTAIVWRVNSRGKLISTMCTAAGAVQAVPNENFVAGFLAEKEYFLRTMRVHHQDYLTTPAHDASIR